MHLNRGGEASIYEGNGLAIVPLIKASVNRCNVFISLKCSFYHNLTPLFYGSPLSRIFVFDVQPIMNTVLSAAPDTVKPNTIALSLCATNCTFVAV